MYNNRSELRGGDGLPVDFTNPDYALEDSCLVIWKHSGGEFRLSRFDHGHESSGSYSFSTLAEAIEAAQMCSRLCCIAFEIGDDAAAGA